MKREDILRMALEAGIVAIHAEGATNWAEEVDALERFAALVAAAEREACAQASEQQIERWVDDRARYAASECAAVIRARN